jgi:hypothetical protein
MVAWLDRVEQGAEIKTPLVFMEVRDGPAHSYGQEIRPYDLARRGWIFSIAAGQ